MTGVTAPDVAGEIVAYRAWRTHGPITRPFHTQERHGALPPITSPGLYPITAAGNGHRWAAAGAAAVCNRDHWSSSLAATDHPAPQHNCSCGWYSRRDLIEAVAEGARSCNHRAMTTHALIVFGACGLWGRVEEHSYGWRAEFARPLLLLRTWEPHSEDYAAAVADSYGIPIEDAPAEVREVLAEYAAEADNFATGGIVTGVTVNVWGEARTLAGALERMTLAITNHFDTLLRRASGRR